ncbi:MAG: hypothetical protein COW73_05815 [Nitrospirae bacterium CG18_big_fil_WC_8_21_14_2_50_70_55]|nr:hypothetical protein [Deltaproteobacteria bacterium]OIP66566.1 MAG: hypothetical protein AUK30_02245 [Nitrospirae bacterium CG2_30_70_394]PIQ05540.1 MAG: hypothetical protein COW73_05815 [Nitrospirae bacterium CG18_big_fil_WC_8_21_14_2_50_70_55]PIU78267.1 MAG: hypothetical protein COS73_07735 [Nitrospirae bacterium CG06_land_8_20_14_3_00_70_43]PIW82794.1 MAG: hypothetical protein COZ96_06965 [Nitrospirae bacterium CG_4_8_14_3_um_filter_70_85]PIX84279.1 MAG: hypothetical protein COZ33_01155 
MESAPRLAAALLVPVAIALGLVAGLGAPTAAHLALAGSAGVAAAVVAARLLARATSRSLHAVRCYLEAAGSNTTALSLPATGEVAELAACAARLCRTHAAREATLARERDALAQILDRMAEGVMVVDRDGRVERTNPSLDRLLELRPSAEPVGAGRWSREAAGASPAGDPFVELGEACATQNVARVRAHESAHGSVWLRRSGPSPTATEPHSTPGEATGSHAVQLACSRAMTTGAVQEALLTTAAGRTLVVTAAPAGGGAVVVFHDITEMHRALEVRRDFVANASHELKTPVAAILGAAETLTGGGLADSAVAARFTATIHRHAQRLAHLIDDLLAISRLEAGTPVERRPVAIGEVVAEVCGLLEESFCGAGVALTCHIDANLAPWRGDRRAVEEILTNLLDNARGYTPAGGAVEVRLAATDHGVALRVRDTGIGIAAEHLDRIFERFYRVDPARSRAAGGTGLGLALVKHLTDALGGKVAVASEVGVGTTFTVELPYGEERPS